jgi:uncharacterized protein (TIGR02265 family)
MGSSNPRRRSERPASVCSHARPARSPPCRSDRSVSVCSRQKRAGFRDIALESCYLSRRMEERLVFQIAVKSLFDSLAKTAQPAVAAQWKALGIDIDRLLPAYPLETWWKAIEVAAAQGTGEPVARLRSLGLRLVERYADSLMGRATLPLVRVLGPKRSLLRSQTTFRSGNNYLEVESEVLEPCCVRLTVNENSINSQLIAGSFEGLVRYAGAKDPEVTLRLEPNRTVYEVRWLA